jgi:deazaflavin-dependent oxidoreductase (nitroreductase family)
MARTYHVNAIVRAVNRLSRVLIEREMGPKQRYLLTVRGRKTGKEYSAPVALIERGGRRYLVAPYGEMNWARNARAAGRVTLARGKRSETLSIAQVSAEESAPVLKEYLAVEPITGPYFDARLDSPLEAFVAEAPRHPVFVLLK